MQRYAAIDVGTNSVKLHMGERQPGGGWRTVVERAEITRLGEGLAEIGEIGAAGRDRTIAAIAGMVDEAGRDGVVAIAAVGTAGLRIASNGAGVVTAIAGRTGVTLEIITGEEEARLAYLGAMASLPSIEGLVAVFDTGGGSSQFTFGHGARVDERFSVDVGAVRYTERFGLDRAVTADALSDVLAEISADLSRLDGRATPDAIVAIGGAATNLAAVKHGLAVYDPDVVQGTTLGAAEVDRQVELYRIRDADARRRITGLQPARADVILAGACIIRTVMDKLGRSSLVVSDHGLRHGLLVDRFGG